MHQTFFGFNLEFGLIFKLGKEIVTDWMKHIRWQILTVTRQKTSCGTILSIDECMYVHIYIYIYIWISICGSLCVFVDEWPKKGTLSPTSLKRRRSIQKTCPRAWRPHKELCPRKSARLEEKDEASRSVRSDTPKQSVKNETLGCYKTRSCLDLKKRKEEKKKKKKTEVTTSSSQPKMKS